MIGPKRIVIVRHGESEGNVMTMEQLKLSNEIHHAYALTEKGKEQARRTGEWLRLQYPRFDAYFVSTFRRNQETFKEMFPLVRPTIDSRINEQHRGIWYYMTEPRLVELFPDELVTREREGWYHYRPLSGQSCQDVEVQIHSFLDTLRHRYSGKTVLMIGHGNWQLLFWRVVLNKTVAEVEHRYHHNKYKNASVTIYENKDDQLVNVMDNYVPFQSLPAQLTLEHRAQALTQKTS